MLRLSLSCALALLFVTPAVARAGIIDSDTGEVSHGGLDDVDAPSSGGGGSLCPSVALDDGECAFAIHGSVAVDSRLCETDRDALPGLCADPASIPLAGIQVKVSGATKYGTWNHWDTDTTNAAGEFCVVQVKSGGACNGRFVKVEAKLDGGDFKVEPTKWWTLRNTRTAEGGKQRLRGRSHDVGDFVFVSPTAAGGGFDLDDFEAWSQASIWALYSDALEFFADLGSRYAFHNKFSVRYNQDLFVIGDGVEASYSNPSTGNIHIRFNPSNDDFDADTLLHELMHTWVYQHDSGATGLTLDLVKSFNTHEAYEDSHIAFHEGFPAYAARELMNRLYGHRTGNERFFSRTFLYANGWTTLESLQHNDFRWRDIFRLLVRERLHRYDFGHVERTPHWFGKIIQFTIEYFPPATGGWANPDALPGITYVCNRRWSLDFEDLLTVFLADAGAGYPANITRHEMNIEDFLARAVDILDNFEPVHADIAAAILDPRDTRQPAELMQCLNVF